MISICIATFNRVPQLTCLLQAILHEIERPLVPVEVVVCDNDGNRSAESVVRAVSKDADILIRYYCEPEQNISIARNRTVQEAKGQWIAFIDDDEIPAKNWLTSLYAAVHTFKADGAFGAVIPNLPQEADASIKALGFYSPHIIETGTKLKIRDLASGNALINSKTIRKLSGPFDKQFGLTGGEDTLLFGTLLEKYDAVFIWCAESVVYETVSLTRCTRTWLTRRAFRSGQAYALIERKIYGNARGLLRLMWALIMLLYLLVVTPIFFVLNKINFQKKLIELVSKLGQLSSVFPWRYREYKK